MASHSEGAGDPDEGFNLPWNKYAVLVILTILLFILFVGLLVFEAPNFAWSIVLMAALTVLFAGLLNATGTFKGTGGTVTGAAGVFLVMFLAVEGVKRLDQSGKIKDLEGQLKSQRTNHDKGIEKLIENHKATVESLNQKIDTLKSQTEELEINLKNRDSGNIITSYSVKAHEELEHQFGGSYYINIEQLSDKADGEIYIRALDNDKNIHVTCFIIRYKIDKRPKLVLFPQQWAGEEPCFRSK